MQGQRPDDLAYFKTLPTTCGTDWIVYAACMEKPGCKPRLQIGSGTHATTGGQGRLDQYSAERLLPVLVKRSLDEGYVISHIGVICSAPRPDPAQVPLTRLLFIGLEGTFAYLFWSMNAYKSDYGMGFTCLWDWRSLAWDSLSTHSPFDESIHSEFDLTEEELVEHAAAMEIKRKQVRARINSNSHYRQMETNYADYTDAAVERTREWREANPGRRNATERIYQATVRAKHVEDKTFYCSTCQKPFTADAMLQKHLNGPKHLRMVIKNSPALLSALKASSKHFCELCARSFVRSDALGRHLKTQEHLDSVQARDATGSASTSP